jgi:hypothetical protein
MANITWTYTSILAALQSWPTDEDAAYLAEVPNIIGLGELRLVRDLNLELFDRTDVSVSTVIGTATVAKPSTAIAMRDVGITVTGKYVDLEKRSLTWCKMYAPDPSVTGVPIYWCDISEALIGLFPTPIAVYVVSQHIVARPTDGLSAGSPSATSWLSRTVPDALFAACLMEAEQFIKADDRYADFRTKYYEELLPVARLELRNSVRVGDASPLAAQPVTQ